MSKKWFGMTLLLVAVGQAGAANILTNGDFETGDFTGWTQSDWFIDSLNPHSGVYDASTGCFGASCTTAGDPNAAYLFQDVATTPGATYDLSFFYDSGQLATSGSGLLVLWGNPAALSLSTVADFQNVSTSGAYVQYSGIVTASSTTSELEFLGRQDNDFYYVDDVSLTAASSRVPEVESLSLIFFGIFSGSLANIAHRRWRSVLRDFCFNLKNSLSNCLEHLAGLNPIQRGNRSSPSSQRILRRSSGLPRITLVRYAQISLNPVTSGSLICFGSSSVQTRDPDIIS